MQNAIECIAIDTWEGDEHAGFYSNKVFENFKRDFIKYDNIAKYIRKRFSEAVSMFENKSIDILHIDGLHTYEAVKEDFETWLPKLSDLGIILLHDTQAKTKDFGVWKLWEELQNTYPSFEFEHSHGLGVLLVGQNPPAHIKLLFNAMKREEVVKLVKYFFSGIAGVEISKKVLKQSIKRSVQKEFKKSYNWRIGRLFTYLPSQFYKLIKKQKREQL